MQQDKKSPDVADESVDDKCVDLGKGFPQILHDRAHEAGEELHKLLVSLSTAGIAVYFVALTSKIDPPLTYLQRGTILGGLGFMALSLGCGIFAWYADMKRNFFWACALQKRNKQSREEHYTQRDRWICKKHRAVVGLDFFFIVGIMCSVAYVVMRVVQR